MPVKNVLVRTLIAFALNCQNRCAQYCHQQKHLAKTQNSREYFIICLSEDSALKIDRIMQNVGAQRLLSTYLLLGETIVRRLCTMSNGFGTLSIRIFQQGSIQQSHQYCLPSV